MAIIDVSPFVLRDVTLFFGTDNYKKHVSSVEFTPSSSPTTWKGLGGNSFTATGLASWTCALGYAQDWATEDSLSRFLFEHEGETIAVTFEPVSGGPGFTANLTITPGSIGGAVDGVAVATVTLGSDKPVFVPGA